jgi:pyruvate/2-oxoglutarate dehydrogenase complex dihydrolipoamide acyltransferase (E2) component
VRRLSEGPPATDDGLTTAAFEVLMRVPEFRAEVHATEAAAFEECIWRLERFVRDTGRLPRAHAPSHGDAEAPAASKGAAAGDTNASSRVEAWERELAEWSALQRRLALRLAAAQHPASAMTPERVARLLKVPGWADT